MNYILPKSIHNIIDKINIHGYESHIVGGCVRDMLLNKTPTDWDITTNATPNEIKAMFVKTFDTGIKHGTVTVLYEDVSAEITTWRKETSYSDHRRPDSVMFTNSLIEDLSRRDFTINAMAYHPNQGLIDPFLGVNDLEKRVIRCVGNPMHRFSEDALRMLRAVRFSSQLNFVIEENTLTAIQALAEDIIHISKERIQSELNKILQSHTPSQLYLIWETGLDKVIFPQIGHLPQIWREVIKHFIGYKHQKIILLVLLFYLSFKTNSLPNAKDFLNIFKYDNKTCRSVTSHLKCLDSIGALTPRNIRKAATEYGNTITRNVLEINIVLKYASVNNKALKINLLNEVCPVNPAISGKDLMNLGLKGRDIKDMLDIIYHCLYENPGINTKDTLIDLVKRIHSKDCFF